MKKLLFFPLLFLALFTVTSCDDGGETPTPTNDLTETEQNLFGNWKMNSFEEKYYDESGALIHTTGDVQNNLFEYKDDGTLRYKIGEDPTWNTRKYDLEQENTPKMLNVYNAAGDEVEISYKIEKLTATEMVLVHEYNDATYQIDGETYPAARVAKSYSYNKL